MAERMELDFIELDALHWKANWTEARDEDFRSDVLEAVSADAWVVAGNYHVVRDLIWTRAEAVVWLDYPFLVVFWRLLTRTIRRSWRREELWNGNREKFWWHLKLWSDDSLFHWLIKTYWRRKRETPELLKLPQYAHLHLIHLETPRQAEEWLGSLPEAPSGARR